MLDYTDMLQEEVKQCSLQQLRLEVVRNPPIRKDLEKNAWWDRVLVALFVIAVASSWTEPVSILCIIINSVFLGYKLTVWRARAGLLHYLRQKQRWYEHELTLREGVYEGLRGKDS